MPTLKNKKIILGDEDKLLKNILSSRIKLSPRKIDKPVILYGAGSMGKMAKDFLDYMHIPFLYVVDKNDNGYKTDKYWRGVKITHPNKVGGADKKNCMLVICVVTTPPISLRDKLKASGWEDVVFFYDISQYYADKYPINNGWFLNKLKREEKDFIKKVFSLLADKSSQSHYLRMLAWRRLRAELLFEDKSVNSDNRFFIPEVVRILKDNEIFVDCGAHKGSVTEKFLKIVKNKYNAIYAIEPDDASFKILKKQLGNIPRVKTTRCALSDKNGEGKFYKGFDFASKLDKKGKSLAKTARLDSLNTKATFIKMHLEGGELNALRGAIKTIQKERPIVAVTLYHSPDGAWRIPLFLMNNTKNYKYYIRQHSWAGTGAVFYAIPKEK